MSDTNFSRTNADNYLKTTYGPAGVVILNSRTPTLKRLPKKVAKFGKAFEESVELSIGVGVGAGEFYPDAGVEKVERVTFGPKRLYAVGVIDRMLSKTAVGGETAFIDANKHKFRRTQEGFAWNMERMLWTKASEGLGTVDALVTNSDPSFVVSVTAGTWKQYNFEVGTKINFGTSLEKFTITAIDRSLKRITCSRDSGSAIPTSADKIYMQNSKDVELTSIPDVLEATTGNLYGLAVQDRWQAHQQLSVSATCTEELIDNAVLDTQDRTGSTESDSITDIITSNKQWKILKSGETGLKSYTVPNANVPKQLSASLGLTALQYFSPVTMGAVPIYTSRFVYDDRMYGLNMARARFLMVHDPMFFEDDGGVLRKTPDRRDTWEFVYGTYGEFYAYPPYHFAVGGLL